MVFASDAEQSLAQAVAGLVAGNPFLPERLEAERAALGDAFDPEGTLWHTRAEPERTPNVVRIGERVAAGVERARERIAGGTRVNAEARALYDALVLYALYDRYQAEFYRLVTDPTAATRRVAFFGSFATDLARDAFVDPTGPATPAEVAHLFACFFQVRRAFHHIFGNILGTSVAVTRLRAAVWQSIFTHDHGRYRRTLYARMGDIPTLITGPSGTGKELVAQAIGRSRYLPFDPERQAFTQDPSAAFFPLNLSALSPTLIESELFGHQRGAFTGALQDRPGWFETCPPHGTVFLDEIGDVEPAIQVKLLRVLQTRAFSRLGDTAPRRFQGKVITATNRDLATEMAAGRFREDFYYRLCADQITTPALAEQLRDSPDELRLLLHAIAGRVAGDEEAAALAIEAETWIRTHLGPAYPWPGNVRELEQCVRNLVIRGVYRPRAIAPTNGDARHALAAALLQGTLTVDELIGRYCTLVYAQTGSQAETARRLGLDRRTVRARIDRAWLAALGAAPGASGNGDD